MGRVLDYRDQPNRKICSLYPSLLDRFGIHLDSFEGSTQRLQEV